MSILNNKPQTEFEFDWLAQDLIQIENIYFQNPDAATGCVTNKHEMVRFNSIRFINVSLLIITLKH